ncbi:MAG TPA: hypothetical protein VGE15_01825, partial [Sphingobacteriaceae bacterium]
MTSNPFLKKAFVFTFSFCLALSASLAQSAGSITGKVIDGKTKEALEYAAVTVSRTADSSKVVGAISNQSGDFKLNNI